MPKDKPEAPNSEELESQKKKLTHIDTPSRPSDTETIKKQIEEEKRTSQMRKRR